MGDFNKYTSTVNFTPLIEFALQCGKPVSLKKDDFFIRQGDICKTMGYVASGSFRYGCTNNKGEAKVVGYTFENSFVGNYPAFQLQDRSNVDIQALCNCEIYTVTYPQLSLYYESNENHQKLGRQIAETLLWEIYDRMIGMYSLSPEERYAELLNRCPGLFQLITLKELASYLMVRPETLSRIRRKIGKNSLS